MTEKINADSEFEIEPKLLKLNTYKMPNPHQLTFIHSSPYDNKIKDD